MTSILDTENPEEVKRSVSTENGTSKEIPHETQEQTKQEQHQPEQVNGSASDTLILNLEDAPSSDIPKIESEAPSKSETKPTDILLDGLAASEKDDAAGDGMDLEDWLKEDDLEKITSADGTGAKGDDNGGSNNVKNVSEVDKTEAAIKTNGKEGEVENPIKVGDSSEENIEKEQALGWNDKDNQVSVQELCAFYEAAATPSKGSTTSLASLDSDENQDPDSEKLIQENSQNENGKQANNGEESTSKKAEASEVEIVSDQMKEDQEFATQTLIMDLQTAVQEHLNGREDAMERARKAEDRVKHLEEALKSKNMLETELKETKVSLESVSSDREHLLAELEKLRKHRDEHEQKQIVLSNRLNGAKKKEAAKANLAEKLQHEIQMLQDELKNVREKLEKTEEEKNKIASESTTTKGKFEQQLKKLETSVSEEKRLNDERKKKMKAFVESKQEELRDARSQKDELSLELSQTNRSLREHHSRWKQLHAQWVQSQTRNRELQRDINRMKKESENMSRLGDRMNEKLSQSAQETEEHKNKRMNAKQELMSLLATLETEREVSSKLRDSIKFTFTPKALSQQQILKESLRDFEVELEKLSQRLGRTLPQMNETPVEMLDEDEEDEDKGANGSRRSRSEIDTAHLLSNLEDETQRVSQCIMAMASKIERLHMMIAQRAERSCATVLTDILAGVTIASDERTMTGSNYGQVPTVNH